MHPILKNILVVIAGVVLGSVVNIALVGIGPSIIPPPEGANTTTMEGLAESMHLFEPKHFLFPWLAHALGTLVGAFVVAKWSASRKLFLALFVGFWFLLGGIYMVVQIPATPLWFKVVDLAGAYPLMAWMGYKLAKK